MLAGLKLITPREGLDFDLEGDIPTYWFGGDPFKTRFFDSLSTIFPEGERFFISCVRDFRDQIGDDNLKNEVKDFIRQEAQHGIVHDKFNARLKSQGIDVDMLENYGRRLSDYTRSTSSKEFTIALTAASEHLTAIMAHAFFTRKEIFEGADARMHALYAWHAMEEVEHKGVAFDVMIKVAKVGYFTRIAALITNSITLPIHTFLTLAYMLRKDGYGFFEQVKMWGRGLWWLYKPDGLFMPLIPHYIKYFKPNYHPWQEGVTSAYDTWIEAFNRTGDPVYAGKAISK